MATISGILNNASGVRPNTKIILKSIKTTGSILNYSPDFTIVTDADGAYNFECNPSLYSVTISQNGMQRENVGAIRVYYDTQATDINTLILCPIEDLTPEIVRQVLEAQAAAEKAAAEAEAAAKTAADDATNFIQQNVNNWDVQINSQFIYGNGGDWVDAPAQITDADKLTFWDFTDGKGYAVKGSVTLPISKPISPVNDDNWFVATSVNLTRMRTDSASQMGGVYEKDYATGDAIPADAMKDKLMYWHGGQFYSIGTDTGFTSNDFDADVSKGWFVSAESLTRGHLVMSKPTAKLVNFNNGQKIVLSDTGFTYQYHTNRELIDGYSNTEITFDDELHILTNDGGMLVFDDYSKLNQLETNNYNKYNAKLIGKTDSITIDCYGDSITFGQANANDAGSVNTVGTPTKFGDGSTHKHWQFTNNYPFLLYSQCANYVVQNIKINNKGYSGASTRSGYLMHRDSTTADIATVMYGVNDCLNATNNGKIMNGLNTGLYSIENFTIMLRKFVAREILRGKAVIIYGAIPFGSLKGYDGTNLSAMKICKAYSDASEAVANEFGCLFIDTYEDILRQFDSTIYNDGTHLNPDKGLPILAARLSAVLLAGAYKSDNVQVGNNSVILAHEVHSRVRGPKQAIIPILPNSTSSTPSFFVGKNFIEPTTTLIEVGKGLCISFYANSDNLIVYPIMFLNGEKTGDIFLDFGTEQSQRLNDESVGLGSGIKNSPSAKSVVFRKSEAVNKIDPHLANSNALFIPTKGWHSVIVKNTSDGQVFLDSLLFKSLNIKNDLEVMAKAHFNTNPIVVGVEDNIASVERVSAGNYIVTLSNEIPATSMFTLNTINTGPNIISTISINSGTSIKLSVMRVSDTGSSHEPVDAQALTFTAIGEVKTWS